MTFEHLEHAALVVIDVQNDFCPGGALEVPDGDAVVAVINAIAPRFPARILTQGLASARPSLVRVEPRGEGAVRDHRPPLRRAGAVARPLRAGHGRGVLPPGSFDRRRGPGAAQGLPARDRLLFRVLRKRPRHPRPASPATCATGGSRACSSPASPPTSVSPGPRSTAPGKVSRARSSRTPAGGSIWRARWTRPGRGWPRQGWLGSGCRNHSLPVQPARPARPVRPARRNAIPTRHGRNRAPVGNGLAFANLSGGNMEAGRS